MRVRMCRSCFMLVVFHATNNDISSRVVVSSKRLHSWRGQVHKRRYFYSAEDNSIKPTDPNISSLVDWAGHARELALIG